MIGKRIVEEEQQGKERAVYGQGLIKNLSKELQSEFGKGFSVANLKNFRQFYLTFAEDEKSYTLCSQLSCVSRDAALFYSRLVPRLSQRALYAVDRHGIFRGGSEVVAATEGGEDRNRVSVRHPVFAQKKKSFLRQGDVAVLGALAAMDVDLHPFAVDVGYLQVKGLPQSQAA